jgi:hypothetical protein
VLERAFTERVLKRLEGMGKVADGVEAFLTTVSLVACC